jgi:hypothetical protein
LETLAGFGGRWKMEDGTPQLEWRTDTMSKQTSVGKLETIFRVGTYFCEMSYRPGAGLSAQWTPDLPRQLSDEMRREYRRGRDSLLAEVAKAIGQAVLVVEA